MNLVGIVSYEDTLLGSGRDEDADDVRLIIDLLSAPEVLHGATWRNLDTLSRYIEGVAAEPLIDRQVRLAHDALKAQYRVEVKRLVQRLNDTIERHPGVFGVHTAVGFDPFKHFYAVYNDVMHSATLILETEGGSSHRTVNSGRLVVNTALL